MCEEAGTQTTQHKTSYVSCAEKELLAYKMKDKDGILANKDSDSGNRKSFVGNY